MLKIEINCSPEEIDGHMSALGFERNKATTPIPAGWTRYSASTDVSHATLGNISGDVPAMEDSIRRAQDAFVAMAAARADERPIEVAADDPEELKQAAETLNTEPAYDLGGAYDMGAIAIVVDPLEPAPGFHPSGRPVGKAANGRNRRNAAEVAEDKAYELAHPEQFAKPPTVEKPKAEPAPIEPPVVSEEDAAQDEQDEAEESAANREDAELTLENVREAIGRYQKRFGNADAIKNIPALIGGAVIEIPRTQEALQAAIDKIDAAVAAPGLLDQPPREATREAVAEAVHLYGVKYDGARGDLAKMPNTVADMPKVLQAEFGRGVETLGKIKDDPTWWGRALTAIETATSDNPFKRVARS